jgi:hypothetical protein
VKSKKILKTKIQECLPKVIDDASRNLREQLEELGRIYGEQPYIFMDHLIVPVWPPCVHSSQIE